MSSLVSALIAFGQGLVAGTIVKIQAGKNWIEGPSVTMVDGISKRRVRAVAAVAEVVPSTIGDAKFSKLAPGYKRAIGPDGKVVATVYGAVLPAGFTGCPFLPCFVGRSLGDPRGITQCGLEQARKNAKAQDAWVVAGGDARPNPGDVLLYVNSIDIPVHVGMFIGMNEDGTWRTADAGQTEGPNSSVEHAKYVNRVYDPVNVTLNGRKLAGWVDLDKVKIHDVASVSGQLVDVRSETEFLSGHLDGAVNVPVDEVTLGAVMTLDKSRPVFTYCRSGARSRRAAHHLDSMGFRVIDLGGISQW